jgi:hypothetical protein
VKNCVHKNTDDLVVRAYFKYEHWEFLAIYCCKCDEVFLVKGHDVRDDKDE